MRNSLSRSALLGLVANHDVAQAAVYFQANGTNGIELWVSDGTEIGTLMLKDITSSGDSEPVRVPSARTCACLAPTC